MQHTAVQTKRNIDWQQTPKQALAFQLLSDMTTQELLFGGAAGGAKTFLGCAWLIVNCYRYPGSRWLMGRAVLKQLKQSTLITFFDVCRRWNIIKGRDYVYNAQEGIIRFTQTGSEIFLKDLAYYPSDPDYDSLGSTEYTGAFIDEASQIREKGKNVVRSRLRYMINEFKIIPKLLMTCNPTKNFLYTEFYKPWKDGTLPVGKMFIQSKVYDNPFLPEAYINTLRSLDKNSQERLLHGNWEYDDDPAALMDFDSITDIFIEQDNYIPTYDIYKRLLPDSRKTYIVADIARFGVDRTVITVWKGLTCIYIRTYKKTSNPTVVNLIKEVATKYNVPASHILVDEDGIGGGVKDRMYGIKGFIARTRPFKKENYDSLKSQCAYMLAQKVNARELKVVAVSNDFKQLVIEELEQIKAKDIDKDGPMAIVSKDVVKAAIKRSPDISDCLLMRMYFELASMPRVTFF